MVDEQFCTWHYLSFRMCFIIELCFVNSVNLKYAMFSHADDETLSFDFAETFQTHTHIHTHVEEEVVKV